MECDPHNRRLPGERGTRKITSIVKSISPARAYGNGNNGNWVSRVRLDQVQALMRNNPHPVGVEFENPAMNHPLTGAPEEAIYRILPIGVTIKA